MLKQELNNKDDYLDQLFESSSMQLTYQKGKLIYQQGDVANGVYQVLKGRVKLTNTKASKKINGIDRGIIFYIMYRFDVFGLLDFFNAKITRRCTARAMDEEVIIHFIPFSELERHIYNSDSGNLELINVLISRCDTNWEKYCDLQTMELNEIVLGYLKKIAQEGGIKTKKGIVLKGISQKDLADFIGLSRQSVTKVMVSLRISGEIEYSRKQILMIKILD